MPDSNSPTSVPSTPSQGAQVIYREKLWPNAWIWIIATGISGAGILMFAPISAAAGYTAAAVLFAIIAVLLVDINDSSDRTPYWLTSTRHPDELTAALSRK